MISVLNGVKYLIKKLDNSMGQDKRFNVILIYLIFPIIIFIVMHYGMKEIMNIHIASDEFGYWTAAANIIGYDWSQCASLNEYYSFGYGIVLAPLLLLDNVNLIYKAALYINIIFVIISYFEIIKIVENLFITSKEKVEYAFISFSVNVYAGLVFYTKLTLVECLLWVCFCTSILLLQEYILYKKNIYLIMTCLVNIFMLWIHMRTIGIIAALVFSFIIYCILMKKDIREYFWVGMILGFGIIFLFYFKDILENTQYFDSISHANEWSGQINKLKTLISYNGFKNLILNIIGRIWYLGNSTLLIFYFGIYYLIKKYREAFNKKNEHILFYAYILGSIFFAICISSLYMIEISKGRRDILFYGRYSENVIAPVLALGMIEIIENKYLLKKLIIICSLQLINTIIVHKTIIDYKMHSCLDVSIPGFYYWMKKDNFSNEVYFSASLFVIFIAVICIVVFASVNEHKKFYKLIIWTVFCIFSITLGYKSYEISDIHDHDEDYFEVYKSIKNNIEGKTDIILYCYRDTDTKVHYSFMGVDRLQFLLKDKIINFVNLDLEELTQESLIITRPDFEADRFLSENCILIIKNKEFNIYEYK